MTIEHDARCGTALEQPPEELFQFVFRSSGAAHLLQRARALLAAAPPELSESFEQAVRGSGLAS